MHTAYFNRFTIDLLPDDAESGSHQGNCSDDIAALRRVPYIAEQLASIDENDLRHELARWGAWSDDDLADHDANLSRILWIACFDIRDDAENDDQSDAQKGTIPMTDKKHPLPIWVLIGHVMNDDTMFVVCHFHHYPTKAEKDDQIHSVQIDKGDIVKFRLAYIG